VTTVAIAAVAIYIKRKNRGVELLLEQLDSTRERLDEALANPLDLLEQFI